MKFTSAVAAILMTSSASYAADAIIYEGSEAVVIADTFSWTGGYIGVNAGYAGGKLQNAWRYDSTDMSITQSYQENLNPTGSGFVGGMQAGYNWQFDQTVFGIETDFQASGIKTNLSNIVWGHPIDTNASLRVDGLSNKVSWFGTTRARIGYTAVDRLLVYATAGIAYGKVKSSLDGLFLSQEFSNSVSKTKIGYTAGAGAEYAFTDKWTLKTEYLYTDLGKVNFSGIAIYHDIDTLGEYSGRNKFNFHTVRVGLNYKF